MPFPEMVDLRKGLVPETFAGVEDRFCFVSLDMDLYQPTYEALLFFWDRMVQGGMIICHDYYESGTPGIKKALEDFELYIGRVVPKTPICDSISMVLIKD
jgi:hypothetical protein